MVRQFALYMASLGIEAYIPSHFTKTEKPVIHVLTDDEIRELFSKIDNYVPGQNGQVFQRLATEYKVIFRLIYCCGLRISEARKLKWIDIDWNNGTARIMQSKGRKDRLVYIADDLKSLLQVYGSLLKNSYNCESEWIFPAKDPAACLGNATLDLQFRTRWKETHFAENCDRAPTVHCLRHTYVVKRMNLWMEKGISLKEMMPFLSRYLGHSSPDDTFYYYHQVDSAFRIIRERDKTSSKVIPEVLSYE